MAKMLLTWRATVFSLITSSSAIARFVLPVATSRTTSSSRAVNPPAGCGAPRRESASSRATSGAAPSSSKARRAASSSSSAASLSPSCRHARETRTRARANSYGAPSSCQVRLAWRSWARAAEGVAVGQRDRSAGLRDQSGQHAAAKARRTRLELGGRLSRLLELAHREHDLDERRQQAHSRERLSRLRERPPDRSRRGLAVPLGKAQQREARLRFPAERAGVPIRVLGGGRLATQAVQLALPVGRLARRQPARAETRAANRSRACPTSSSASRHAP